LRSFLTGARLDLAPVLFWWRVLGEIQASSSPVHILPTGSQVVARSNLATLLLATLLVTLLVTFVGWKNWGLQIFMIG